MISPSVNRFFTNTNNTTNLICTEILTITHETANLVHVPNSINIKIGGKAGEGIKVTGLILSKSLARLGFSLFTYDEYPSLIRGGHNTYQVYASSNEIHSQHKLLNILIAFDEETFKVHQKELKKDAWVLFDTDIFKLKDSASLNLLPVPWTRLAEKSSGSSVSANMVALGSVFALMSLPNRILKTVTKDVFAGKGSAVCYNNIQAIKAGASFINKPGIELILPTSKSKQIVLSGNEAVGLGAIASGLKYFASYPMTPTTPILHFLADNAERYNIIVNHAENEIAAINTLIGASTAGVRAMTATSGGGFSLMVEGLGMAGIAEVPMVIVLGMRPGPATGMPTWTGQGDLKFVIHASQDEFPRIVLTPGDSFEAFELTKKAFILAEKYQMPVIILIDKYLGESQKSGSIFPARHKNKRFGFITKASRKYNRYALTESGVSPRPHLGQEGGAGVVANSYEHGVNSLGSEEETDRISQTEKRLKKMESVQDDFWELPIFGPKSAQINLVGFGSTLGPAREALKQLPDTNYLHFNYVWPFPSSAKNILKKAKKLVCLEGNAQGQLQGLISEFGGIKISQSLRKFNGRPFYPEEIADFVKKIKR